MRSLFLCLFILFFGESVAVDTATLKTGETINFSAFQERDLTICEAIFHASFSNAYKHFKEQDLGVADKDQYLQKLFADLYTDWQKGEQKMFVAKKNGQVVGFVGFKKTGVPHQICINQVAVDPEHWNKGIGKHLVFSALTAYPDSNYLIAHPLKIHKGGRDFFRSIGFKQSTFVPGYDPKKFTRYDWVKRSK